ncbi:MAG: hypothetical protein ABJH06_02825 [Paraglaciecola sp.]|uniref:hypothetical protein n=1 Tax=Paraglaciecola sp. TaxID=1920173 RepID=UPI00329889F9
MNYLNALFLVFALCVNTYAGAGLCTMEHEAKTEKTQAMPCHDVDQVQEQHHSAESQPHVCDCDMCVQITCSVNITKSNALFNETPHFVGMPYKSLSTSPNYRPPIYFLS